MSFKNKFIFFVGILLGSSFIGNGTLKYFSNKQQPVVKLNTQKIELGRMLFHDPILNSDSTISCASCHQQKSAFSDRGKKFSSGIDGFKTRRNTQPLFNLEWNSKMFWDGRANTIEEQVFHPVRDLNEMGLSWELAANRLNRSKRYKPIFQQFYPNQQIDSIMIAEMIGQFERTLVSNNSKYDSVLLGLTKFTEDEAEGFVIVNDQSMGNCFHCHNTDGNAVGTSGLFANNGLDTNKFANSYTDKGLGETTKNIADNGRFKIPSFRNLLFTSPYMHDGRFETLEQVIEFYSSGINQSANLDHKIAHAEKGGMNLTAKEQQQIIAFLKTLTDYNFVNDPKFSNPFQ